VAVITVVVAVVQDPTAVTLARGAAIIEVRSEHVAADSLEAQEVVVSQVVHEEEDSQAVLVEVASEAVHAEAEEDS